MGRDEFCAFCGKVFVGAAGKALRVECRECHHGIQSLPLLLPSLSQDIDNGRYVVLPCVLLPYDQFLFASAYSLLAFFISSPFRFGVAGF